MPALSSCLLAGLAAAALLASPLHAQGSEPAAPPKDIVPAGVPAFTAFGQWVQWAVPPTAAPTDLVVERVQPLPWVPPAGAAAAVSADYQPLPVILGSPELPLLRPVSLPAGTAWSPLFNYQGMHVRFVVLDARGRQRELRPMSDPPRPGERFKIRVTPTFDAVAEVDLVLGSGWQRQRVGQVWPQPGMSLEIRAGETAELPLQPAEFFVMPAAGQLQAQPQALVLAVRHPQALGSARSAQPAYRLDSSRGSDYLQLVTPRQWPTFEQLITPGTSGR